MLSSYEERIVISLSRKQKKLIARAAEISGQTLSDFVVASGHEAALKVIQDHEIIRLARADQIAFVSALLDRP